MPQATGALQTKENNRNIEQAEHSETASEHPTKHLAKYKGWMHADGYSGFNDLYRSGKVREVACMAHMRAWSSDDALSRSRKSAWAKGSTRLFFSAPASFQRRCAATVEN